VTPDIVDIERRLAAYLGADVTYLRILASGWETIVFEFRLGASASEVSDLPVGQALVLRFYQGSRAVDKGSHEAAVMRLLADLKYPLPKPYVFEPDSEALGAPFLIMEKVTGRPLFQVSSFPRSFKAFSMGFIAFVRAQVRLHSLGSNARIPKITVPPVYTNAVAMSDKPLLERMLGTIERRIEDGPLPGLRDALTLLRTRATRYSPAPATIVHMDYHPQNVMVDGFRVTGVLDWVNADYGDRYLCAATSAVILSTTAMQPPKWMGENAAGNSLRSMFASLYLALYHSLAPMEWERFRYAQAVAGLLRLSMFGMMRNRGAESVGFRSEAIENISPAVVRLLTRYVSRKAGLPVSI
jgi:aminoglycoside phosphotransferase (APT) family kinase protein